MVEKKEFNYQEQRRERVNMLLLSDLAKFSIYQLMLEAYQFGWMDRVDYDREKQGEQDG
jgi:hypothetical protein